MSKSNPVHPWRFGRTRALIFTQKWLKRAKIGMVHATPKIFLRPNKSVSRVFKTQLSKINWKIKSIFYGLATRTFYFLKKYDTKWPKFPPCRNWPICGGHTDGCDIMHFKPFGGLLDAHWGPKRHTFPYNNWPLGEKLLSAPGPKSQHQKHSVPKELFLWQQRLLHEHKICSLLKKESFN